MGHDETHFLEGNQLQMNCENLDRKISGGVSTVFCTMEPVAFYIIHRAQREGPFTLDQLQEMIAMGKITPEQSGWCSGMTEWRPLNEFMPPMVPKSTPPLSAPSTFAPVQPPAQKRSKTWVWVTLAVLVVLGGFGVLMGYGAYAILKKGSAEMAYLPLQEERSGHEVPWQNSSLKSIGPAEQPNGKNFLQIRYHSPAGELSAYLTPDPKDGKRHPAIVWAHSFSGGIGSMFWQHNQEGHDLTARAFRDKGIVMMCPSWRGENENPGRIELHYGEVDDFLAAIEHVKKLPYVDPNRVYIGGHDVGGTLTLLAACASDQFQAAFSLGGMLDGIAMLKRLPSSQLPFNPGATQELWLRSPLRYASFIRKPVFYFEASGSFEQDAARRMQQRAGSHFQAFPIEGTHFDIVAPLTYLIAEKIAANQEISFTTNELTDNFKTLAFKASQRKPPVQSQDSYGLASIIAKTELHPYIAPALKEEDLTTLRSAMESLIEQKDYSPKAFAAVSKLSDLRNKIRDQQLLQMYDSVLAPEFSQWALQRVKLPAEMTKAEEDCIFAILVVHGGIPTNFAGADLTAAVLKRGMQPDSLEWYKVYSIYGIRSPLTAHLMRALAVAPPAGRGGKLVLNHINMLIQQGWEGDHPYNSLHGLDVLKSWMESSKPESIELASGAARTAAYLKAEFRDVLIPMALQHPQASVRLAAAWADAKSGGTTGVPLLKKACVDVQQSAAAQGLLKNLLLEDEIPLEVRDPGFITKSMVALTLAHTSFLGEPPLSIDIYDHKDLFWPPSRQRGDIWLLKFTFRSKDGGAAKTGYAMQSTLVNCYFLKGDVTSTVPEDIYLRACASEFMGYAKSKNDPTAKKEAWKRALMALRENNPGVFDAIKVPDDDAKP
ncbi:MAG: GYF domain-containing protein [Prosthecobacter sp.]|uniref:alpha/beta fold hydrolase n=1 Tax=Prosthecobacter sp. TaxID=1965333 RepID=UPI0025E822AF|nr:GYF domain-containing protein [Prosthecobacter sp.]MCF7785856.1 GYF domain-containing protein [Prosthecobacter sp.]